jgi:hypothetical protein
VYNHRNNDYVTVEVEYENVMMKVVGSIDSQEIEISEDVIEEMNEFVK